VPTQQVPSRAEELSNAEPPLRGLGKIKVPSMSVPKRGMGVVRAMIVVNLVGIIVLVVLFSRLNKSASKSRAIRVAPSRAIANETQPPATSQATGVVSSGDAVKAQ